MEQTASRETRWRVALLALCAIAFCVLVSKIIQLFVVPPGLIGMRTEGTSTPFVRRIVSVAPGGDANRAGLHAGDTINLQSATPDARYRFINRFILGDRETYTVTHNGVSRSVDILITKPYHVGAVGWMWFTGSLGALALCALIAWRRPDSPAARLLVAYWCVYVPAIAMLGINWVTRSVPFDLAAATAAEILLGLEFALMIFYALIFARPVSVARRNIAYAALAVTVFSTLFQACIPIGQWSGTFDPRESFWASAAMSPAQFALESIANALFVTLVVFTFAATRGKERSLFVWTITIIAARSLSVVVFLLVTRVSGVADNHGFGDLLRFGLNFGVFLSPLAMTYALLSRRLLDIVFVINRAIVFAAVSLLMVAVFVLVEWGVNEWFVIQSHAANALVAAGLALVLGLSMRFVHRHVDNAVDRVFFAKRRRDQDAIEVFAGEAPYITDRNVLIARTEETLVRHADASHVQLFLGQGTRYGPVDENDPAIVTLRARHDLLDLHGIRTAVPGEFAVPMVSRGRLVSVLAIGHKNSGEAYAPDELHIIRRMADRVASAVDTLGQQSIVDPILERLDSIQRALVALSEKLQIRTP